MRQPLNKHDTYGVLLAALQFSSVNKDFRLLSDLIYLFDEDTFKKFIALYEGQTITIPTREELTEIMKMLTYHAYTVTEGMTRAEALKKMGYAGKDNKAFLKRYQEFKNAAYQGYIKTGGFLRDFRPDGSSHNT